MKTLMTGFFVVVGAGFVINGAEDKSDPWRAVRFFSGHLHWNSAACQTFHCCTYHSFDCDHRFSRRLATRVSGSKH